MSKMTWEAALWVGVALGAPSLAGWIWPRLGPRFGEWARPAETLGRWVHGLLPAYLAVVTGAVSGRDAGLYGSTGGEWAVSVLACGVALIAAALVLWWKPLSLQLPPPLHGMVDEPRWALYRAAGVLWTGAWVPGVFIGLALCGLESAAASQPWKQLSRSELRSPGSLWKGGAGLPAETRTLLLRMALSTVLFLATRNLWVTAAVQAGLLALQRPRPVGFSGGRQIANGLSSSGRGGRSVGADRAAGSGADAGEVESRQAEEGEGWSNGS
jgi:hypothetical protein